MSPHTLQSRKQRRGVEEAVQHRGMCGRKLAAALPLQQAGMCGRKSAAELPLQHAGMCGRKSAAALPLVTWFAVMGTGSDAGKVLHV